MNQPKHVLVAMTKLEIILYSLAIVVLLIILGALYGASQSSNHYAKAIKECEQITGRQCELVALPR